MAFGIDKSIGLSLDIETDHNIDLLTYSNETKDILRYSLTLNLFTFVVAPTGGNAHCIYKLPPVELRGQGQ